MERIWLKSYPAGMPADVTWDENQSIGELFEKSCKQFADRPAFHCMGKTLTFAQIDKMSRDFAAWVQSKGLAKGTRVAIMMPNCLQYPIVLFGTLRAGYTVVNVNPLYTARELEHQLKDSGAEVIVILENFAHHAGGGAAAHAGQARGGGFPGRPARREGPDRQFRGAQREEDGAGLRAAERERFNDVLQRRRGHAA